MKDNKTIIDDLLESEIKLNVQKRVNAEIISSVAAQAARDIRVNNELNFIFKSDYKSRVNFKPFVWYYFAIFLTSVFLLIIPLLTIDKETISEVPNVLSELEFTITNSQVEQTSIVLLTSVVFLLLVFLFIFAPMWNNLKRLDKI